MTAEKAFALRSRSGGFIRAVLCLGLLVAIYFSFAQGLAEWNFRKGTVPGIRSAIVWNSRNPRYYSELAAILRFSPEAGAGSNFARGQGGVMEVIALAEKAANLAPHAAEDWADLAYAYEWVGRADDALSSLQRARDLFPNSPDINWKLGNFYLRTGRTVEGLRALRKTVAGDPEMRWAAFDLAMRASGNASLVAAEMLPADADAVAQFLRYLVAEKQWHGADESWRYLVSLDLPIDPKLVFPYFDALIQRRESAKLASAWAELTRRNGTLSRRASMPSNLLFNGDFESEILNGGLDWRVSPLEGVTLALDTMVFFDGTHSLRLRFAGTKNLNFEQVYQFVPVKPRSHYRFSGYIRTKEIATDSGIRFQVYDAYNPARLLLMTNSITGTANWSPQLLEFTTGPDTILLIVRVVRLPSQKLDNRIQGTAWIDRVTLNLVQ